MKVIKSEYCYRFKRTNTGERNMRIEMMLPASNKEKALL